MSILHDFPFNKVPFYFMRHGETDWNREHIYQGQTDTSLNVAGLCQAYRVANDTISNLNIQRIYHSPLSRAKKTAEVISLVTQIPLFELDELKEVCWGEMEGKRKADHPYVSKDWEQYITPPGGESKTDLIKRIERALQICLEEAEDDDTLIISHGAVYKVLQHIFNLAQLTPTLSCCTLAHIIPPHRANKKWSIEFLKT